MKKFLIIVVSIVIFSMGVYATVVLKSAPASLDELALKGVSVEDGAVTITGEFVSSASVYKGNTYTVDGDSLYVEVQRGLSNIFNRNGEFSFKVNVDMTRITQIYFVSGEAKKLIWEK